MRSRSRQLAGTAVIGALEAGAVAIEAGEAGCDIFVHEGLGKHGFGGGGGIGTLEGTFKGGEHRDFDAPESIELPTGSDHFFDEKFFVRGDGPVPNLLLRQMYNTHVTPGRPVGVSILIGVFLGGAIGFLARPSAPATGQLPFETVLTAGSQLHGLDELLKPVAQQSFKYLVMGVTLGGIAGLIIGNMGKRPAVRRAAPTKATGAWCFNCGNAIPRSTEYCPRCGIKRGKISPRAGV